MAKRAKTTLHMRALVFFFMLISILLLIISGSILDSADLEDAMRHILIGLHKVGASVFSVAIGFHVYSNWKSILKYTTKRGSEFNYTKELTISLAAMALIVFLVGIYVFNKYL
jgi:hypothetical protein